MMFAFHHRTAYWIQDTQHNCCLYTACSPELQSMHFFVHSIPCRRSYSNPPFLHYSYNTSRSMDFASKRISTTSPSRSSDKLPSVGDANTHIGAESAPSGSSSHIVHFIIVALHQPGRHGLTRWASVSVYRVLNIFFVLSLISITNRKWSDGAVRIGA